VSPPREQPSAVQKPNLGVHDRQQANNRFIRWSRLGVFERIFAGLAGEGPRPERIMIDATHLKVHRALLVRILDNNKA
jgi:transposase